MIENNDNEFEILTDEDEAPDDSELTLSVEQKEEEAFEFFSDDEPISRTTSLGYTISIYLDPKTRKVDSIFSEGPFGTSEYDPEGESWVALETSDTWRLRDLENNSIIYHVNWKNDNDFDENDDLITLKKYSDGTLDEEYLKANAVSIAASIKE